MHYKRYQITSLELIAELVKLIPDGDACLEWPRGRYANGYGVYRANGKNHKVHREAYRLVHGPIPEGLIIRHSCDNPACFRPSHLLVGTHSDNAIDRESRHRRTILRGSQKPESKLTESQVLEIRSIKNLTHVQIGLRFGVCRQTIEDILHRRIWRHV